MPDFVVTQTAKEFFDYSKKKQREATINSLIVILISIVACGVGYYYLHSLVVK